MTSRIAVVTSLSNFHFTHVRVELRHRHSLVDKLMCLRSL